MKANVKVDYFKRKASTGRPFWLLGAMVSLLIVFGLSTPSFFRPYYEHQNEDMPTDSVALEYDLDLSFVDEPLSYAQIMEKVPDEKSEWQRIIEISDSRETILCVSDFYYMNAYALIAPAEFNLNRLGNTKNLPVHEMPSDDHWTILATSSSEADKIGDTSFFQHAPEGVKIDRDFVPSQSEAFPDDLIPFHAAYRGSLLFLIPEGSLPSGQLFSRGSYYSVFHLTEPLNDADLNYFGNISGFSSGIIPNVATDFIHPGTPYLRYYGLFHPIANAIFLLSITIAASLALSQIGKEFIRTRKEKREIFDLKTLGMSATTYAIGNAIIKGSPLVISSLAVYGLYFIFMAIFTKVAGFTFFFPWWGHLIFFAFPTALVLYLIGQGLFDYHASHALR
ncbi:MAG: hypothetical protein ACI32C_02635 [Candidatus Enteromonas sp.]